MAPARILFTPPIGSEPIGFGGGLWIFGGGLLITPWGYSRIELEESYPVMGLTSLEVE